MYDHVTRMSAININIINQVRFKCITKPRILESNSKFISDFSMICTRVCNPFKASRQYREICHFCLMLYNQNAFDKREFHIFMFFLNAHVHALLLIYVFYKFETCILNLLSEENMISKMNIVVKFIAINNSLIMEGGIRK